MSNCVCVFRIKRTKDLKKGNVKYNDSAKYETITKKKKERNRKNRTRNQRIQDIF